MPATSFSMAADASRLAPVVMRPLIPHICTSIKERKQRASKVIGPGHGLAHANNMRSRGCNDGAELRLVRRKTHGSLSIIRKLPPQKALKAPQCGRKTQQKPVIRKA